VLEKATVPDFFQEETSHALRLQIDWLKAEFDVDNSFVAALLKTDQTTFANWRYRNGALPPGGEDTLRRLWQMALHLLSFLNFDSDRVRGLLVHRAVARSRATDSALTPPWSDMTLKEYLERVGSPAIESVERWITGLRFGDPDPA
jgi:hypothetical protein